LFCLKFGLKHPGGSPWLNRTSGKLAIDGGSSFGCVYLNRDKDKNIIA
jgi:hypothetical protein